MLLYSGGHAQQHIRFDADFHYDVREQWVARVAVLSPVQRCVGSQRSKVHTHRIQLCQFCIEAYPVI